MTTSTNPLLYQINTRVWLTDLSKNWVALPRWMTLPTPNWIRYPKIFG